MWLGTRGNFVKRKRGLRTHRVLACLVNPRKTEEGNSPNCCCWLDSLALSPTASFSTSRDKQGNQRKEIPQNGGGGWLRDAQASTASSFARWAEISVKRWELNFSHVPPWFAFEDLASAGRRATQREQKTSVQLTSPTWLCASAVRVGY